MARNVLIPTDFTIRSLSAIQALMENKHDREVNIVLLHILDLEYDIIELLFLNQFVKPYSLISDEFEEACEVLKKKHRSRLASLKVRFAYNDGKSYLRNVLKSEGIDEIIIPEAIELELPSKRSVPMIKVLKSLGYPVYCIPEEKMTENYSVLSALNVQVIKAY